MGISFKSRGVALLNNPRILRASFQPIQRFRPTIALGRRIVVTRHEDVREVLDRDDVLTVAENNGATMDRVNGPFVLGMDRSAQYDREKGILRQAVHVHDLDRIRGFVRQTAAELVDRAAPEGQIDVVQGLSRPAAVRLVASYFGVAGPDEVTMLRWMRAIFHETFLNVGGDPRVRRAGEQSAAEFHAYMDELISRRKAEGEPGLVAADDFLTRLVRMQARDGTSLSDEGVRRNIGGVVVGAVETTSKAVTHALDELLRRPDALAGATAAAKAGDTAALTGYALEALRFNPLNPVLARHVARQAVLAAGTRRHRSLVPGQSVYAAILPAMFDPSVFEDPSVFKPNRPLGAYLHFGHGLHTCFGEQINLVQIPELLAALLRLDGLRRGPRYSGKIVYDGPFPDHLVVAFDPSEDGPAKEPARAA